MSTAFTNPYERGRIAIATQNEDARRAFFLIALDECETDLELTPFESNFLVTFIDRLPSEPKAREQRASLQTWSPKQRAAIDQMRQKFSAYVRS